MVPTLNLKTEQEMLPKTGVYVTETALGKSIFPSVTNLGLRPTFNGAHLTVESYLFDFDRELNSGEMEVQFLKRLRDEKKFLGSRAVARAGLERHRKRQGISPRSPKVALAAFPTGPPRDSAHYLRQFPQSPPTSVRLIVISRSQSREICRFKSS